MADHNLQYSQMLPNSFLPQQQQAQAQAQLQHHQQQLQAHQQNQQNQHNQQLQQQQQQQQQNQQLQQLQSAQLADPTMAGSMDPRLWQRIQMQGFRQPQGQPSQQQQQPSDMSQANAALIRQAQLAVVARGGVPPTQQQLAAAHQQLSQQQAQQGQQPSFGMQQNMQQMGQHLAQNQPQPFHDPSNSHMSGQFPTIGGMPNNSPSSIQPRPNSALNANYQRQVELMMAAQTPQSGQPVQRINQPSQPQSQIRPDQPQAFQSPSLAHATPGDMFPSPGMPPDVLRRPSPLPVNLQPAANIVPGPSNPQRNGAFSASIDMQRTIGQMKQNILTSENQLRDFNAALIAARGTPQEAQLAKQLKDLQNEIHLKRQRYQTFIATAIHRKQVTVNPAGPWAGQGNQNPPFDPNRQAGMLHQQHPSMFPPSMNASGATQQQAPFPNQVGVPPRQIPTPLQQPQQGHPGAPQNPGMSSPFTTATPNQSITAPLPYTVPGPVAPVGGAVPPQPNQPDASAALQMALINGPPPSAPPCDKNRFDMTLRPLLQRKGIKLETRNLMVDNRPIDPHALHVLVWQEGGFNKVDSKELWNVIAGRLGFVQFPGTESDPPKSGPGIAQQVYNIYKDYLAPFEAWYSLGVSENNKKQLHAQMATFRWTPQQMQHVVGLSNQSVQELHSQGIPEKMIQFIEQNRASLQRNYQEQRLFANRVRSQIGQEGPGGGGSTDQQPGGPAPPGVAAPVMGPSASFNPGMPVNQMALRQQQFLQQQHQANQIQQQINQQNQQNQSGQQQHPQQQQPNMGMPGRPMIPQLMNGNAMAGRPLPIGQGGKLQHSHYMQLFMKSRQELAAAVATMSVDVPPDQRIEFNHTLETVHRSISDEPRMQMFLHLAQNLPNQEGVLKRLAHITAAAMHQRTLLSNSTTPRYIVSLEQLKGMSSDVTKMLDLMSASFTKNPQALQQVGAAGPTLLQQQQQMMNQQQQTAQAHQAQQQAHHQQQGGMMAGPMVVPQNPMMPPTEMPQQPRLPVQHASMAGPQQPPQTMAQQLPQQQQQMQHQAQARPPTQPPQPPQQQSKPKQTPKMRPSSAAGINTPSPAPMASTPGPSAATPTAVAASPPSSTKSPKGRPAPKPKPVPTQKRRASKATSITTAPTPEATNQSAAPTPSAGTKRPREEEATSSSSGTGMTTSSSEAGPAAVNEPSPPKRIKTEWTSPQSEAARIKNEVVENIKTEDEAGAWFTQVTDFIKSLAQNGTSGQEITTDISDALDMLLKCPNPVEGIDASLVFGESSAAGAAREGSPSAGGGNDTFEEYIDFSFGTLDDEETNSVAPTPDMVSSSSTNPSPESNHDPDTTMNQYTSLTTLADAKDDQQDPLALSVWKDIDGGETSYYQPIGWKWDSMMPSLEPSWPIMNNTVP